MVYSAKSDDSNTISQFTRRKAITITTGGTSTPADYQVKLTIAYEPEMQADFDDIRFNTRAGAYIDYWIELKTNSSTATVWVELPDAITDPGLDIILMYYGNSGLSSGSSISDVFSVGEDFEGTGTPSGWSTISGTPDYDSTTHVWSGDKSLTVSVNGHIEHPSYNTAGITYVEAMIYATTVANRVYIIYQEEYSRIGIFENAKIILVTSSGNYYSTVLLSANTWYKFVLKHDNVNNLLSAYIYNADGSLKLSVVNKAHVAAVNLHKLLLETHIWVDDFRVRSGLTNEPTPSYGIAQHQRRVTQFIS